MLIIITKVKVVLLYFNLVAPTSKYSMRGLFQHIMLYVSLVEDNSNNSVYVTDTTSTLWMDMNLNDVSGFLKFLVFNTSC